MKSLLLLATLLALAACQNYSLLANQTSNYLNCYGCLNPFSTATKANSYCADNATCWNGTHPGCYSPTSYVHDCLALYNQSSNVCDNITIQINNKTNYNTTVTFNVSMLPHSGCTFLLHGYPNTSILYQNNDTGVKVWATINTYTLFRT